MHTMDGTKKIITIIGLIFEGLAIIGVYFTLWFMKNYQNLPWFSVELESMTQEEIEFLNWLFTLTSTILSVTIFIIVGIFMVNIYLFTRLMKEKYTEEQAKKIYLYQAIWGGFNLLSNQITGVLYLISGVGGYQGHREMKDTREGI